MGWGRMFFLGDFGQQLDIEEQREEVRRLSRQLRRARRSAGGTKELERRIDALERENDELRLYVAALIRHLARKGAVDRTELGRVVTEIDAADGAADGRFEGGLAD